MPPWNDQLLVYVDDEYDQEYGDDGRSRYEAYLKQHLGEFNDPWESASASLQDEVHFTASARL